MTRAANLKDDPGSIPIRCDTSKEHPGFPSLSAALGWCFTPMTQRAHNDGDLLLGMLALERGLIDQYQLLAAFDAWNSGDDRSMGDLLVEQGALDRAGVLFLKSLVDESAPSVSATVAYVRREAAGAGPAEGLLGSSESVERFRIVRPHARGGLGEVFLAVDAELDREVALKELQAYHAHDAESQSRFVREAKITGRLEHPGIVPVYGLGRHADGRPYYAMRFIEGETLKRAIERFHGVHGGPRDSGERELAFRRLLRSFIDACNAVAYAHSRGVVHRDLKPENIMLGRFGETLVVDWGVAKLIAETASEPADSPRIDAPGDELSLTRPGSAIGTPQYMSPEQASGDLMRVLEASDVYGLGATLYCLLVGHGPFPSGDLADVLQRVSRGVFPAPRRLRRSIDAKLEAICLKAMAVKPENRHATPLELAGEIEVWLAEVSYKSEQERALDEVRRSLARLSIERAQNLFARDMPNEGMLWLSRALEEIASNSPSIERAVRASLGGWHSRAKLVERTLSHGCAVHAVAFSPDGRMLATASAEQSVRLWDVAKGGLLSSPIRHEKAVRAIAFSPDGRILATASDDGAMRQWDAMTGAAVCKASVHGVPVPAVCFSPEGTRIATGSGSGAACLWATATGLPIGEPEAEGALMLAIAFSPDGTRLALAGDDGQVRIRETDKGMLLRETLRHEAGVNALAFSADGRRLVSGCRDGRVRIWETQEWTKLAEIACHVKPGCLAYSPAGRSIAMASEDGNARVWHVEPVRPIGEPLVHRRTD